MLAEVLSFAIGTERDASLGLETNRASRPTGRCGASGWNVRSACSAGFVLARSMGHSPCQSHVITAARPLYRVKKCIIDGEKRLSL